MKAFGAQPNYSNAECVITASILVLMLAMGASTLVTREPPAQQVAAGVATTHVAQANRPALVKKI